MPILTIQRRMRELGRIRLGIQVPVEGKPGRHRPEKLSTFRLTSATKEYVEAAAEVYGGTVTAWESPRGPEWETVITSPHLDVIVPPGEVVDPWFELWSGGGCQRRCDGITETLSGRPCLCPADPKKRQELAGKGEACKATTRLNVALPALPDLGVWRLETHSFYAAVELGGTADVLRQATEQGVLIRARLRIDRRQVKRPNEPRKDFIVPVLELPELRLDNMLAAGPITGGPRQLAAGAPSRPALPAGPALPERSDFRPPSAPAQASAADIVAEPGTDSAEAPSAAPGASTEHPPMTREAFVGFLEGQRIATEYAVAVAKDMFPGVAHLDDEQRGALAAVLAAD